MSKHFLASLCLRGTLRAGMLSLILDEPRKVARRVGSVKNTIEHVLDAEILNCRFVPCLKTRSVSHNNLPTLAPIETIDMTWEFRYCSNSYHGIS